MTTSIQNSTSMSSLQSAMNGTSSSTVADAVAETEDRFLKLLVTQMKNQDPLNPLDNAQVTSQMAQLSTVSGINQLNATLESLQASFSVSQSYQAANMIGHGVLVAGSTLSLSSSQGLFGAELGSVADSVKVTIRDTAGNIVRTMDLGSQAAGVLPLGWDGKTDSGGTAADGTYVFEVAATSGGQAVTATTLTFGQVSSVSSDTSGVKLNVQNAGAVGISDVRQIF